MSKSDRAKRRAAMKSTSDASLDLAPIKRRQARNRQGRYMPAKQPPPDIEMLNIRCRRYGIVPSDAARAICRAEWMGSEIGMALQRHVPADDIPATWDKYARWCRAEAQYQARILGLSSSPASAAIMVVPALGDAPFAAETDARSAADRDEDAARSWARWRDVLAQLSPHHLTVMHNVRCGTGPTLWRSGQATRHGLEAVAAMQAFADAAH